MKIKTIGVIGRYGGAVGSAYTDAQHQEQIKSLLQALLLRNYTVILDDVTHTNFFPVPNSLGIKMDRFKIDNIGELQKTVDVVIVLGGDGTMLEAAQRIAPVPVIGVNQGKLGFITDIPNDAAVAGVIVALQDHWIEERSLLELRKIDEAGHTALNDVVILRDTNTSVLSFEVFIDSKFAYAVRADGLIICTPTGSTAYAMSAGGSIMHPSSRAFGLVPMMPQTLSYRPLIVGDESEITVNMIKGGAHVTFDGQEVMTMHKGSTIVISKSEKVVKFMHPAQNYDYLQTLREKLGWHVEPRFK